MKNDQYRLTEANKYINLSTEVDEVLNDIVRLAAAVCECPMAYISVINNKHEWVQAQTGFALNTIPLTTSFATETITQNGIFQVRKPPKKSHWSMERCGTPHYCT